MSTVEQKVLLLRTLGISDADIEALRAGTADLDSVLKKRITFVMADPNCISQSAIVCQNIRRNKETWDTLNAEEHLAHVAELKARGGVFEDNQYVNRTGQNNMYNGISDSYTYDSQKQSGETGSYSYSAHESDKETSSNTYRSASDTPSDASGSCVCPHPVKRFFARYFDLSISLLILNLISRFIINKDLSSRMLVNQSEMYLWSFAVFLLMLLAEPVFISAFGTTPGKFILGISVKHSSGRKLTFRESALRSFMLLRYAFGFLIPIYSLYRGFKSMVDCKKGLVLPWDRDLDIKSNVNNLPFRYLSFIVAAVVVMFIDYAGGILASKPKYCGNITEEEFYKNLAQVVEYNGYSFTINPTFNFTYSNNCITSVELVIEDSSSSLIYGNYAFLYSVIEAFAGSDSSISFFDRLHGRITAPLSDFTRDVSYMCGTSTVTYSIEYKGYKRNIISGILYNDTTEPALCVQRLIITR